MVTRLHILLTYKCSLRCSHCYVYSHQRAAGKISLRKISHFLKNGRKLPDIKRIYYGGGEPFTQYPLLLKAVRRARQYGFEVGVETNGYFARTEEAGMRFLRPLAAMGIQDIRISNDRLHYRNPDSSPARRAMNAAQQLGIATTLVRIPFPEEKDTGNSVNGECNNIIYLWIVLLFIKNLPADHSKKWRDIEPKIKEKRLIATVPLSKKRKANVYAVFEEDI